MSGTTAQPPPAPSGAEEELGCYSGLYSAHAVVERPTSVAELKDVLATARAAGRPVTLRAGGHSFDGQALGEETVISTLGLNRIEVFPERMEMEVEAGATWGEILDALEPHGLVPAVTVTTERATAGGTLSGNCLSRFSPAYGKEGEHIVSFDLMTAEGEEITCAPPPEGVPYDQLPLEQRLFCGVIGGLGYLGVVTRITYRVLRAGEAAPIGVDTDAMRAHDFEQLGDLLVPRLREMYLEDSDPLDSDLNDSIWSAIGTRGDGSLAALVFTSRFTTDPKRRRLLLHRPGLLIRVPFEWLMRLPAFAGLAWRLFMWGFRKEQRYTDDLRGFSFFMDGNARAKRVGKRLGFKMQNAQQTFVVPSDVEADEDQTKSDLVRWLEHAHQYLVERDLAPTLHDVLFLPADDHFLLSATAGLPGYAVSYAFETSNRRRLEQVQDAFRKLSDDLHRDFGGRVYLVKNVFASPQTLEEMYGQNLIDFRALKAEVDPEGTFVDDFYRRVIDPAA